ncbi:hypothetical protein [Actinomyces qiguomingii]|uniref:hypothetical protein n=1 Tax=Actinomyces qiguomingii TaxID=2057800 RepID=UPI001E38F9FF|nr:hypothetical protein [Actinomyces qiguomingii]
MLALGMVSVCTLVIDDGVPRRLAKEHGLNVRGTLGLLCQAIREGQLTIAMVAQLADDLLAGTYYLPFGPGEFRDWAAAQELV